MFEEDATSVTEYAGLGNEGPLDTARTEELSYLFALFGVPLEAATSDAVPNRAYLHILHVPYMNE
jgi:hypothetical protein